MISFFICKKIYRFATKFSIPIGNRNNESMFFLFRISLIRESPSSILSLSIATINACNCYH